MIEKKNTREQLEKLDIDNSSKIQHFFYSIKVDSFRHLNNLPEITFQYPVTVLSGGNKSGKSSILTLIACSHKEFLKLDPSSPTIGLRPFQWRDMIRTVPGKDLISRDWNYTVRYRLNNKKGEKIGYKKISTKKWGGVGKTESKISDRRVVLVDLERIIPARSYSNSLYRKTLSQTPQSQSDKLVEYMGYIFENPIDSIEVIGTHVNKSSFSLGSDNNSYSSFNAASGEEAIFSILDQILDCPKGSLILIEEIEIGLHPKLQRRLIDVIEDVSYKEQKQFIITSHSPTIISSLPKIARRFIDTTGGISEIHAGITLNAALSKMDSELFPLFNVYCEDHVSEFIIKTILHGNHILKYAHFIYGDKTVKTSHGKGTGDTQVIENYNVAKRLFGIQKIKIGYVIILDGDSQQIKNLPNQDNDFLFFLPGTKNPEQELITHYLNKVSNSSLKSALQTENHHTLFNKMVEIGISTDFHSAISLCINCFLETKEGGEYKIELEKFVQKCFNNFTELCD